MPIIAPHLRPSSVYTPECAWADDCYVQWGAKGLVISRSADKPSYTTAFFEAFPRNPKTFIRGEGATIADAERAAFAKFERYSACAKHEFERRGYTNGAGFCKHCEMFASKVFEPSTRCLVCDKPTDWTHGTDERGRTHWFCEDHEAERKARGFKSAIDAILGDD